VQNSLPLTEVKNRG